MKLLFGLLLAVPTLQATVKLPAVLSDNMVLQQGMPVRIWGEAASGEAVTVSMAGQTVKARSENNGEWEAFLRPLTAGGPYEMTIAGSNTITIRNVLIGEVWVASGQSNMGWTLAQSTGADEEIRQSSYPQIRFFKVNTLSVEQPRRDAPGSAWAISNPDNSPRFSGVGYFFAKELHRTRKVPVGVLQSAVGGTPAQAWTSHETLSHDLNLRWYLDRWAKFVEEYPAAKERYEAQLAAWKSKTAEGGTAAQPRAPAGTPGHIHTPSGLYNGMIAPLVNYGIRGAIWYQGEANAGPTDNELYRYLFSEMILDWRRAWNQGPFPFLWVQLANFAPPAERSWAILRDSQTQTLQVANTGQALAIDVGENNDIHPKDKSTVGKRLALAARAVAYGERIVYSGPVMRQVTREEGALRVWFEHTGAGLAAKNGSLLSGFRIASSDGKFFKAEAKVDGKTVVVSSALVRDPAHVRYAWENDPVANLINRDGLPATPFRTDTWK
ncbi:MAG TPA: sialate O-acetylesterase [Bryobacteraceae bacterium]|nr:sialate O-acetylesterase [Bryobacteraceae bacterium]